MPPISMHATEAAIVVPLVYHPARVGVRRVLALVAGDAVWIPESAQAIRDALRDLDPPSATRQEAAP